MINYFSQVIRSQRVKKSLVLVNIIGLSVLQQHYSSYFMYGRS